MCRIISLLQASTSRLQEARWPSGSTALLSGMSPWSWLFSAQSASLPPESSAQKVATIFLFLCLKLFGNGCFEIFGSCPSFSWTPWVTFSGNRHYNYSTPAPNNWAPRGPPALCSHRFDFIYDLFEHVSSRNNQDTLKCGSKHRRPTVSSQFKVSLHCWLP